MYKQLSLSKKLGSITLAVMMSLVSFGIFPALAQSNHQLKMPRALPTPKARPKMEYSPDLLLVMPAANTEQEDIDKALKEAHGTVVDTMGEGKLKVYIVKTERGKLESTEKTLGKDKHFKAISRNYRFRAQLIPNDPNFTGQWHLGAINCPRAWDSTMGNGTKVAIFDSGCQASVADLTGKTQKGYDATTFWARLTVLGGPGLLGDLLGGIGGALSGGAQNDVQGHGTLVATTAAATANNMVNVAGVAPGATVYPVQIAGSSGMTDDIAIMAGMLNMMASGNRIVNISYGAYPPFGFTNAALHAPLHLYFQEFYYIKGGLIFISSGNDGAFDPDPLMPYLNVVSAIDPSMSLANFSNWGTCITFTGPGKDIVCTDRAGNVRTVDGTSFSSPIVASTAALVWNANPSLPNVWVQHILKASCFRAGAAPWTPYYGYGMPDAERAVRMARGL
jgi:subtilisin family serine protease